MFVSSVSSKLCCIAHGPLLSDYSSLKKSRRSRVVRSELMVRDHLRCLQDSRGRFEESATRVAFKESG